MHAELALRTVASISSIAYIVRLERRIERNRRADREEAVARARLEHVIAFRAPLVESRAWERGRI